MFARQVRRTGLVENWLRTLQLEPGAQVLDEGSGPGYVGLVLTGLAGPDGLVDAVAHPAGALAYLERLQTSAAFHTRHTWLARVTTRFPNVRRSSASSTLLPIARL